MHDYDPVFRLMIEATLKNQAGSMFTVEDFRFNRTFVETQMHAAVRSKLGGRICCQIIFLSLFKYFK